MHSDFDVEDLRQKMPIQTGAAAEAIATVCRHLLNVVEHAASEHSARDGDDGLVRVGGLPRHDAHELVQ